MGRMMSEDLKFEVGKTYETCGGFKPGTIMYWERITGLSRIGDTFVVDRVDGDGYARIGMYVVATLQELQSGKVRLVGDTAKTTEQGLKWDLIHKNLKDRATITLYSGKPPKSSRNIADLKITPDPLEDGIMDLGEWSSHTSDTGVSSSEPPEEALEAYPRGYYDLRPDNAPKSSEELLGMDVSDMTFDDAMSFLSIPIRDDVKPSDYVNPRVKVTGGSSPSYYRKSLELPLSSDRGTFVTVDLEATDVSDAWDLNGNQFNVFKSLVRGDNKDGVDACYALDKQIFFSLREKKRLGLITHKQYWQMLVSCGLSKEK